MAKKKKQKEEANTAVSHSAMRTCWYTVPVRIVDCRCCTCNQELVALGHLSVEITGAPEQDSEYLLNVEGLLLMYKLCRIDNAKKVDASRWHTLPFSPTGKAIEHSTPEPTCKAHAPGPRLQFRWTDGKIEEVTHDNN